jgi:SAM-dependent methyltransferase
MLRARMPDAYDLIPYTEHAYAESHPDHLEVIARLAGFRAPGYSPSLTPRVLELGCGRGGNLLPMASFWPEASFVGVDRSAASVRDARTIADAARLTNLTFVEADFTAEGALKGEFDYVLCHGVYSWIPEASRPLLLSRIRASLAQGGLAYVSFNTLPGWYHRMVARDFMRFAATHGMRGGPRAALDWLHAALTPDQWNYGDELKQVYKRLCATDPAYLTHEYLGPDNHPVYASELLAEAADSGLTYLGDALPPESSLVLLGTRGDGYVETMPLPATLDLFDFVRDTAFRRAVLHRAEEAPADDLARIGVYNPARLEPLSVASRFRRAGDGFETDECSIAPAGFFRGALRALSEHAPRSLPVVKLSRQVGVPPHKLAEELLHTWVGTAGLDFHLREPAFTTDVSPHPRADPVARWHALEGGPVTNAWHHEVKLTEEVVRKILSRLDGQTSHEDLARFVESETSALSKDECKSVVAASLSLLARSALLVG